MGQWQRLYRQGNARCRHRTISVHAGAIPGVERYLRSLRQALDIWLAILSDAKTVNHVLPNWFMDYNEVHPHSGVRFLPECTPLDPLLSCYPIELAASRLTRHPIRQVGAPLVGCYDCAQVADATCQVPAGRKVVSGDIARVRSGINTLNGGLYG